LHVALTYSFQGVLPRIIQQKMQQKAATVNEMRPKNDLWPSGRDRLIVRRIGRGIDCAFWGRSF
jgi:hypothetical protein